MTTSLSESVCMGFITLYSLMSHVHSNEKSPGRPNFWLHCVQDRMNPPRLSSCTKQMCAVSQNPKETSRRTTKVGCVLLTLHLLWRLLPYPMRCVHGELIARYASTLRKRTHKHSENKQTCKQAEGNGGVWNVQARSEPGLESIVT